MKTRTEIKKEIALREKQIKKIKSEIRDLNIEAVLLCDKKQWFTEQEEEIVVKRRPKIIEKHLIGRIHWKEYFMDESTGKKVTIERCQTVRIDGQWQ